MADERIPFGTSGGGATVLGADEIILNMGPQHPSTHGVLRVKLRLDGEKVIGVLSSKDILDEIIAEDEKLIRDLETERLMTNTGNY